MIAHAGINLPLKLPGHHGLEWMALLMFARTVAPSTWAATVAATSAAGFASVPVWGFHESTIGLSYLLSGLVVDSLYRVIRLHGVTFAACCAAVAHAAKPLWKWAAVSGAGASFGSIEAGVGYALLTHLAFGLVGGAAGALAGHALLARHRS